MILAVSRFRVANGMEAEVRRAFSRRPRRVDRVVGFQGMEVFTSADDPAVFHLVTRWVDEECFRAWHNSDEHNASHELIPNGLKLDGEQTELRVLRRMDDEPGETAALERLAADESPLLAAVTAQSESLHVAQARTEDGRLVAANQALATSFAMEVGDLLGRSLFELMPAAAATQLRDWINSAERRLERRLILQFVNARDEPFSLHCHVDVSGELFVLAGEPMRTSETELRRTLIELQGELAVAAREQARQARTLAEAKRDLEESHWHLEKISEVLPICLRCRRIKTGGRWEAFTDYLLEHSDFLSHGYCPSCAGTAVEEMQ